jgi:hypothetical protein
VPSTLFRFIEKLLLLRGNRDVTCRIFKPTSAGSPYPAMLEKGAVSEQFFLKSRDVEQFVRGGNDINLTTEVMTALRNLDRRVKKKAAGRS